MAVTIPMDESGNLYTKEVSITGLGRSTYIITPSKVLARVTMELQVNSGSAAVRTTLSSVLKIQDDIFSEQDWSKGVITPVVGTKAFTGVGLDDMTPGIIFTGPFVKNFRVEIDGAGTPDTFQWSNDGGATFEATTVPITGAAQTLEDGVTVTFAATTGHTATDLWAFVGTPPTQSYTAGSVVGISIWQYTSGTSTLRVCG